MAMALERQVANLNPYLCSAPLPNPYLCFPSLNETSRGSFWGSDSGVGGWGPESTNQRIPVSRTRLAFVCLRERLRNYGWVVATGWWLKWVVGQQGWGASFRHFIVPPLLGQSHHLVNFHQIKQVIFKAEPFSTLVSETQTPFGFFD